MNFNLTINELYALNAHLKLPLLEVGLGNKFTTQVKEFVEHNCGDILKSLVDKSLLKEDGDRYVVADAIKPFARPLMGPEFSIMNVFPIEGEFEISEACDVSRKKVETLRNGNIKNDEHILGLYHRNEMSKVITDFLSLDIDHFHKDDPFPPFVTSLSMGNLDKFLSTYKSDPERAVAQHQFDFGFSKENLHTLATLIMDEDCRTYFVVQTKKVNIFYTIRKLNNITIFSYVKESTFGASAVYAHLNTKEFIEWIRPKSFVDRLLS